MARIDSLGNFLADIATAIKNKKGSSDPITAKDFDTEIANLKDADYEALTADKVHLSTKYTDWQTEVEKKDNNLVVVPASIGTTKEYAPIYQEAQFSQVALNFEANMPQITEVLDCNFTSSNPKESIVIKYNTNQSISVQTNVLTNNQNYPYMTCVYNYTWDAANQKYWVDNTRRDIYFMQAGGSASGSSVIDSPESDALKQSFTAELTCTTPDKWRPEMKNIMNAFIYPKNPETIYICRDSQWINIETANITE